MPIRWAELEVVYQLGFAPVRTRQERVASVEPLVSSDGSCSQVVWPCVSCKIGDRRSHSISTV